MSTNVMTAGAQAPSRGAQARAWLILAAGVLDFYACVAWAPQVLPFLAGAAGLWWYAAGTSGPLAKTARDMARPVLTGITLLSTALFALNGFEHGLNPAGVQSVEMGLARARLTIDDWTSLSLVQLLVLAALLLVAIAVAANYGPVTHLRKAKAGIDFVQTVLLVLTSFVIAQAPLQRALDHTHARVASQYEAALDRQWRADSRTAAAHAVVDRVQKLSVAQRQQLLIGFQGTSDSAHNHEQNVADVIDRTPTSNREFDQQLSAVSRTQATASRAESRARETVSFAVGVVGEAVSRAPVPEWLRVAAGALIDNEADANEGRIIGRWFAKEKRADPRGRAADDVWLTGHDLATAAPGFTSVVVPAPAPFPPEVDPALYPRPFWPDSQDPLNPNNFPEVEPGVEGGE